MLSKKPSVSIAIPAHNEEGTIATVVEEGLRVLSEVASDYEILVGNDGSCDQTGEIIERLRQTYPSVQVLHHQRNRGVALTCWALYRMARTEWVAFFPADGQVRPSQLRHMLAGLERFDVVVGLRRHRQDPLSRRLAAWVWNRTGQCFFRLNIRDVDSVKIYPTSLIRSITVESTTPFMETEILIKAIRRGLRVGNVDVEHWPRRTGQSTGLRPQVVAGAIGDMARYWWRHYGRRD